MKPDVLKIALLKEGVPARHELMRIDELHFLPDNPRVYAAIRQMKDFPELTPDEKQRRIYNCLLRERSVKNLMPQVKQDGGLQDPVVVRMDRRQVIEGNSRLAVYKKLWGDTQEEQWRHIRCLVVTTLTDDQQTRLLAQAHLHGKTEWTPYAQALFCFRWVVEDGKDIETLKNLSSLTVHAIKKNVKVIKLMRENHDEKQSNFSYYQVLVTNKKISSTIQTRPDLKDTLFTEIKAQDVSAQQIRQWVPTVIEKPKLLRKYERKDVTLDDAYDRAKISGTERRLKRIRDWLDDIEKKQIDSLEHNEIGAIRQVLRQIERNHKRVSGMLEARADAIKQP